VCNGFRHFGGRHSHDDDIRVRGVPRLACAAVNGNANMRGINVIDEDVQAAFAQAKRYGRADQSSTDNLHCLGLAHASTLSNKAPIPGIGDTPRAA
jgi:hypothetical protein